METPIGNVVCHATMKICINMGTLEPTMPCVFPLTWFWLGSHIYL
jgi:hypothetical protein